MYCEYCGRKFYGCRAYSIHVYINHLTKRAIKYCIYCKHDAIKYCRYCKKYIIYPSYFSCKKCDNCHWCSSCNYKYKNKHKCL